MKNLSQIETREDFFFTVAPECFQIYPSSGSEEKTFEVFFMDALGWLFSIQWFDIHQQVEKIGPAVRTTPRLFDPFETTDLRLYSHLDGSPPIRQTSQQLLAQNSNYMAYQHEQPSNVS